jgi:ketosteroid isomerase-like protein
MEPREVVRLWVACFNQKDADAIADLYSKDATNHQVVRDPVVGKDAIRDMSAGEFAQADRVCQIEHERTIVSSPSGVTTTN